jgi:hypothetical protein
MKVTYQTKEAEYSEMDISPETVYAINSYKKYLKAQARLEKAEREMNESSFKIPEEEMVAYVAITNKMESEY